MTTTPKLGDVLTEVIWKSSECRPSTMDARDAAAQAIAAYLMNATFTRSNGTDDFAPLTPFQLRSARREWPGPGEVLEYPCVSIIDFGEGHYDSSSLTPTCIEGSFGKYAPGTALWKTSELVADFQIDFWTNDKPTRAAIAARLPNLFSPGENFGVEIACSAEYWSSSVRASLLGSVREDDSGSAYVQERRLRTTIRAEIPVLDLRGGSRADFSAQATEVGPSVEITTSADVDSGNCSA
jgi:hypothetical protein